MKKYRIRENSVAYWVRGFAMAIGLVLLLSMPCTIMSFIDPILP